MSIITKKPNPNAAFLLELKWWDWDIEKIEANFEALSSGDLTLIKKIGK